MPSLCVGGGRAGTTSRRDGLGEIPGQRLAACRDGVDAEGPTARGVRLRFAAKCPLPSRISFNGWSAPAGVTAAALAEVMGSSLPDAPKNVK